MRRGIAGLGVLLGLITAAPAAAAALSAGALPEGPPGTFLIFMAAPGETNDLQLNLRLTDARLHARDWDAPLTSSAPGCEPDRELGDAFLCALDGIAGLFGDLGDGDDTWGAPGNYPLALVADGGAGNDTLLPGEGPHTYDGGAGNDGIGGGPVADALTGGPGQDRITAYAGDDRATGGGGDDDLTGMQGNDRLSGGGGQDEIWGDGQEPGGYAGRDVLRGGAGDDTLDGGPGRDLLYGGPGRDRLVAADVLASDRTDGRDVVNCGPGRDDAAIVDRRDTVRGCERVRYVE